MGKEARLKEVRKQLRNICQELMPEVMTKELYISVREELNKSMELRFDAVDKHVKATLATIDERSKDIQGFMLRQMATLNNAPITDVVPPSLEQTKTEEAK